MSNQREIGARAKFFLKNQQRIEEWAKLASDVHVEAHDFYSSLVEPLGEAATGMAGEPQVFAHLDRTGSPKFFLMHPSWASSPKRQAGSRCPVVGIGLEWSSKPTFESAYSGVWVNRDAPYLETAKALEIAIAKAVGPLLAGSGKSASWPQYKVSGSNWWPAWRYERPGSQAYWEGDGLDDYAGALVKVVTGLWSGTWEAVHKAVEECVPGALG